MADLVPVAKDRALSGFIYPQRFAFGLFKQAWIDSGGEFDQVLIDGIVPKEAD